MVVILVIVVRSAFVRFLTFSKFLRKVLIRLINVKTNWKIDDRNILRGIAFNACFSSTFLEVLLSRNRHEFFLGFWVIKIWDVDRIWDDTYIFFRLIVAALVVKRRLFLQRILFLINCSSIFSTIRDIYSCILGIHHSTKTLVTVLAVRWLRIFILLWWMVNRAVTLHFRK